jgi:hypothetical protein
MKKLVTYVLRRIVNQPCYVFSPSLHEEISELLIKCICAGEQRESADPKRCLQSVYLWVEFIIIYVSTSELQLYKNCQLR